MATTWEGLRFEFESHKEWHDKYFTEFPAFLTDEYEGSKILVSVCKECGSMVISLRHGISYLSDHRAWHDKLEEKTCGTG